MLHHWYCYRQVGCLCLPLMFKSVVVLGEEFLPLARCVISLTIDLITRRKKNDDRRLASSYPPPISISLFRSFVFSLRLPSLRVFLPSFLLPSYIPMTPFIFKRLHLSMSVAHRISAAP